MGGLVGGGEYRLIDLMVKCLPSDVLLNAEEFKGDLEA